MSPSLDRSSVKNIWIVQTGFVGDIILALPLAFECARVFPQAHISFFTTGVGVELFENAKAGGLKNFAGRISAHQFRKRGEHKGFFQLRRWVKELTSGTAPDAVFCAQRSLRSGLLAYLSGAKVRVGFSSGAATFFYTTLVPREWEGARSEIEKNLDLLRALVPDVAPWSPEDAPSLLNPFHEVSSREKELSASRHNGPTSNTAHAAAPGRSGPRVGISIGSPWPTKMWPLEENIQLAKMLTARGVEVVLLGDPAAVSLGAEIEKSVPSLLLKNLIGKTSIAEWIHEISLLDVLLSGDSAAVHVASDLRIPVVALFGPTIPEFGFAPWRKKSVVLQVKGLDCRPCDIHGPKVCPKGHHRCLKDIPHGRVSRFVDRFLEDGISS